MSYKAISRSNEKFGLPASCSRRMELYMPTKHRLRGFTLIELLVVIAIIALLVSILLPSLNKAKELANKVVCMSNLKGIGTSWAMYADQNDDIFPSNLENDGCEQGRWYWQLKLMEDGYCDDKNIFKCPTDKITRSVSGVLPEHLVPLSYGSTGWPSNDSGYPYDEATGRSITSFDDPSRSICLMDYHNASKTLYGCAFQWPTGVLAAGYTVDANTSSYPHDDRSNTLLADTHVESLDIYQAADDYISYYTVE